MLRVLNLLKGQTRFDVLHETEEGTCTKDQFLLRHFWFGLVLFFSQRIKIQLDITQFAYKEDYKYKLISQMCLENVVDCAW